MGINVDKEVLRIEEEIAKLQEQKNMLLKLSKDIFPTDKSLVKAWYDMCDTPMRYSDALTEVAKIYFPWGEKYFRNCNTFDINVGNFQVRIPISRVRMIQIEYLGKIFSEPKEIKANRSEELYYAYADALSKKSIHNAIDCRVEMYDNNRKYKSWYKASLYFTKLYWKDKSEKRDAKWYYSEAEKLKKGRIETMKNNQDGYGEYMSHIVKFVEDILPQIREFAGDMYKVSSPQHQLKGLFEI